MLHVKITTAIAFAEIISGGKTFELRKDDRPYQIGDTILLQEQNEDGGLFTGREAPLTITSLVRPGKKVGLKFGHVLIGFTVGAVQTNELPAGYGAKLFIAPAAQAPTPTPAAMVNGEGLGMSSVGSDTDEGEIPAFLKEETGLNGTTTKTKGKGGK